MKQLLRSFQTKALANTTLAETPMTRKQSGATPLILMSHGTIVTRLMFQKRKRKKSRKRKNGARSSPEQEKTTEDDRR